MKQSLACFALLASLPLLVGFKFIDPPRAWHQNDLPLEYWVGDAQPAGLSQSDTLEGIEQSFQNWSDVPCSPLEANFAGEIDNDTSGFGRPDITLFTFDGGAKDDLGSGPLAATVTHSSNDVVTHNGQSFFRTTSMNIIYNEGLSWGMPEDIASPNCHNRYDWIGVTTHEIGHGYGLGHSCDDGEPCPDPILRWATMYWSVSSCNDSQQIPGEDHHAGINAIYGVSVDFEVEGDGDQASLVGGVPLTITVSVPEDFQGDQYSRYEWNFGDGTIQEQDADELTPVSHSYEEEGQYTISLLVEGQDEECGGFFEADQRKVGVVLACEEPQPEFGYQNLGEHRVQLENTSPLGAFGCITGFEWWVDGNEDSAQSSYEPTLSFDEPGTHSVTLRASGPGGSAEYTAEVIVTADADEGGCDCSSSGRVKGEPLPLLAALLLLAVRRRALRRS
ncbi:MAG: hypothetical protein CMP23_14235 [Rickettsiales bacterium]|nr:hypothetical protein [Rickettsiales bacterium]